MKILLVDDSQIVLARLALLLSEVEGVEIVGQVSSGEHAIKMFRQTRPDVVTIDIRMPGTNGIALLKEIKKEKPTAIAIMCTNFVGPEYRKACADAGADYFLDKSSSAEDLIEVFGTVGEVLKERSSP